MNKFLFTLLTLTYCLSGLSQNQDQDAIKQLFDQELTSGKSYSMLEYLATKIGARVSGSPGAAAGVDWSRHTMEDFADVVKLQPVMVPHWVRGQQELAKIINSKKQGTVELSVCALGGS